jgi:hypothetical protein
MELESSLQLSQQNVPNHTFSRFNAVYILSLQFFKILSTDIHPSATKSPKLSFPLALSGYKSVRVSQHYTD